MSLVKEEAAEIINLISDKVKELGPGAEQALGETVGYISAQAIGTIIVLLIGSVGLGALSVKSIKYGLSNVDDPNDFHPAYLVGGVAGIACVFGSIFFLCDFPDALARVFHPIGYLVERVIN